MKGDHQQKEPEKSASVEAEVPAEKKEEGGGADGEKKHGGYRRHFKGGRGGWKNDGGRGKGRWKGRGSDPGREFRRQEKAEDLYQASLAQKKDRVVSFDCKIRPKSELSDWLRHNKPSTLKRSDGIGYIAILSDSIDTDSEEKFAIAGASADPENQHSELLEVWRSLVADPSCLVTYSTIKNLARKFKVRGGKWLFTVEGTEKVDDLWMFLCSSVLASNEDVRLNCLAVKITPVQDVEEEGVKSKNRHSHMVSVHTRDFCDEDDVFEVEKRLRSIPVRCQMTYKPDLFSVLGIYRNNRFKLRPTIYSSEWHPMGGTSVVDSIFDASWSYRGGAGDLRELAVESDKAVQGVAPEKVIDDPKGEEPEDSEAKSEEKRKKGDPEIEPEKVEGREEGTEDSKAKMKEDKVKEKGEGPVVVEKDDAEFKENDDNDPVDLVDRAIKVVLRGAEKTGAKGV